MLSGELEPALEAARQACYQANILHYERDIVRAEWLLGSALTRLAVQKSEQNREQLREADAVLAEALKRCRQIDMVDYEANILLACARLSYAKGDCTQAKTVCVEALSITNRSGFRVLRADVRNFLAVLELEEGHWQQAIEQAQSAKKDANCNGGPYCYRSASNLADSLLEQAQAHS